MSVVLCHQPSGSCFSRSSRILSSREFREFLSLTYFTKTKNFVCYRKFSGKNARIGFIVGKKQAKKAVTRNTLKRLIRESFRCQQDKLFGYDIIIRLCVRVSNQQFFSATSQRFKMAYSSEILVLLDRCASMI